MRLQQNVSLKPYNTFGLDVPAEFFAELTNIDELTEATNFHDTKHVLGGGSNVLLTKPVTGIVLLNRLKGITIEKENAKQAIPADRKGAISVQLGKEDKYALISIQDNGAGISEEAMSRIFQPYFTTKSSGTGLGLAMTKKIIEFWKGEIWFETSEGSGTIFYIRMPLMTEGV